MAQRNLRAAADAVERAPGKAKRLGCSGEEIAAWRLAADGIAVPYDERLEIHPQAADFTRHAMWNFAATVDRYPLLLHFPYFDLYRKQVVKQADLVLALHLRGDAFTPEEKARNFAYYEAITVRDSSLSACTQAVIAAETGHLDLAYDYFAEAATWTSRISSTTLATGCTSPRWPGHGSPRSPASAVCVITTKPLPSVPACPGN